MLNNKMLWLFHYKHVTHNKIYYFTTNSVFMCTLSKCLLLSSNKPNVDTSKQSLYELCNKKYMTKLSLQLFECEPCTANLNTRRGNGEMTPEERWEQRVIKRQTELERGTDTYKVDQVSWPCLFDSKQFRWDTAVSTEADNSSAGVVLHDMAQSQRRQSHITALLINNGKFYCKLRQPTLSTNWQELNKKEKVQQVIMKLCFILFEMEKQIYVNNNNCSFTCKVAAAQWVAGPRYSPHDDGYDVAWLKGYRKQQSASGKEQSRAACLPLPVLLS